MSTLTPLRVTEPSFGRSEIGFALAWEIHAPGLGGWTIAHDQDEDGSDVLLVDPPLVFGDGFEIRPDSEGVRIISALGQHRAATLREALLLICPLSPAALTAAERLAVAPDLELMVELPPF